MGEGDEHIGTRQRVFCGMCTQRGRPMGNTHVSERSDGKGIWKGVRLMHAPDPPARTLEAVFGSSRRRSCCTYRHQRPPTPNLVSCWTTCARCNGFPQSLGFQTSESTTTQRGLFEEKKRKKKNGRGWRVGGGVVLVVAAPSPGVMIDESHTFSRRPREAHRGPLVIPGVVISLVLLPNICDAL